ncbi:cytochrome c oxidase assembly factor Coa1 family protein [Treponema sp. OMZ 840]|uniref:cytochrome c oxidase assembly factor Coa1 family protein n=1 Tax=Treponema sp. OMZ 840 TaxID=244313 RepID=UPI003D902ED2
MANAFIFFIFLLLWLGPVIPGIIVAKKKNRSVHWMWLSVWPGIGLWVLIIMIILKPLKVCSVCGKKVGQEAKVCPYCTTPYERIPRSEEERKIEKKESMIKLIGIISIAFVIASVFITVIFVSVTAAFTNSEPYQHTIKLIRDNPELQEYLGENFERKGMISGSISTSGDSSGKAVMSFKLKGRNGISRVYVDAYKENGIWNYNKIVFYKKPGEPESVNLLDTPDIKSNR